MLPSLSHTCWGGYAGKPVMSQWSWKVSGFGFRDFCSSFRMRQSLLGRWCDTVQNRNICMQMNSAGLQWIIQQKETYDVKGIKTNATWGWAEGEEAALWVLRNTDSSHHWTKLPCPAEPALYSCLVQLIQTSLGNPFSFLPLFLFNGIVFLSRSR